MRLPEAISPTARELPIMKNIFQVSGKYWRVKVGRRGIRYIVNIPFGSDREAAFRRAIAERDRFYAIHGRTSPHSNTGIAGISETVKWTSNKPYPCFSVTVGASRVHRPVRFMYRGLADRTRSLRAAIAHRARLAGEDPAELLAQAREALCL